MVFGILEVVVCDRCELVREELTRDGFCALDATVADNRTEYGFESVGKNGRTGGNTRLALADPEFEECAEIDVLGHRRQVATLDEAGAHERKAMFGGIGQRIEQHPADDEAERRIAEELEAFEVVRAGALVRERPVEQRAVPERVAEAAFERGKPTAFGRQ